MTNVALGAVLRERYGEPLWFDHYWVRCAQCGHWCRWVEACDVCAVRAARRRMARQGGDPA